MGCGVGGRENKSVCAKEISAIGAREGRQQMDQTIKKSEVKDGLGLASKAADDDGERASNV